MTIGLLLEAIIVGLTVVGVGFMTFYFIFEKEWLTKASILTYVIVELYAIVLSFIYQNFPQVWNTPL